MLIETERLRLQPLAVEDAPALARLFAGDWEAIKQTGRMPYPPTEAALGRWLRAYVAPASHSFLITGRRDRLPIGGIGFGGRGGAAELGYALGRRFWGRGYATESVRAMATHASSVGYRVLEAFCFIENPASVRVLEKAGSPTSACSNGIIRSAAACGGCAGSRCGWPSPARTLEPSRTFATADDPAMLVPLEGGTGSWTIASSVAAASRCRRSALAR